MNYLNAIREVIKAEGGSKITEYKNDPGGITKYGISKKSYPNLDIRNLTEADAIAIYKRDYWDRIGGDKLNYHVAYAIFNYAVNRGVKVAVKYAQRIVGAVQDGTMGQKTIDAINAFNPTTFLGQYLAMAEKGYEELVAANPALADFLEGWKNRVSHISDYVGVKPAVAVSGVVMIMGVFF